MYILARGASVTGTVVERESENESGEDNRDGNGERGREYIAGRLELGTDSAVLFYFIYFVFGRNATEREERESRPSLMY
jgi:hypothetical protein